MRKIYLIVIILLSGSLFSADIQQKNIGIHSVTCVFSHSSDDEGYLYTGMHTMGNPRALSYQPVLDKDGENVGCKRENK